MRNFSKQIELGLYTLVLFFSLVLLAYIGSSDVRKGYTKLKLDEAVSVSKIVQQKINNFLYNGQRAKDFRGFKAFTNPIVYSNLSILKIGFIDSKNKTVFSNKNSLRPIVKEEYSLIEDVSILPDNDKSSTHKVLYKESTTYYKIDLPLYNKFEDIGYLSVIFPKSAVSETLDLEFEKIYYSVPAITLLYLLFLAITNRRWGAKWKLFITSSYSFSYISLASFMVYILIVLYTSGIEGKSKALTQTLVDRLNLASDVAIPLEAFKDLSGLLDSYVKEGSDIALMEIKKGNEVFASSSTQLNESSLEIKIYLDGYLKDYYISSYIPQSIIYGKLWRNTKNFLILFVSSTIVAFMFLDIAVIFRRKSEVVSKVKMTEEDKDKEEILKLEIVKPVFFLTIFAEGLMLSFLPQYLEQSALKSGFESSSASLLFTIYFLVYALVLIPAPKYVEKYGTKKFLLLGVALYSFGSFLLFSSDSFYVLIIARLVGGIGQGMVFFGVQSYIVEVASEHRRTQATSIIVYGYNAGILSGTALGALLVKFLGSTGVFAIYTSIGIFLFVQIIFLFKTNRIKAPIRTKRNDLLESLINIKTVFLNKCISKSILLVGMPTKIILGGGVIFAIPLLLSKEGYMPEDIGQIVIFYSIGVLLLMPFGAYVSDRFNSKLALSIGSLLSAVALMLIANYAWSDSLVVNTASILGAMLLLGFAHAFIHAPIISFVTECEVPKELTKARVTAAYRFIERIGHAAGPAIAAQIILYTHGSMSTFALLSIFILIVAITFIVLPGRKKSRMMAPKMSNSS